MTDILGEQVFRMPPCSKLLTECYTDSFLGVRQGVSEDPSALHRDFRKFVEGGQRGCGSGMGVQVYRRQLNLIKGGENTVNETLFVLQVREGCFDITHVRGSWLKVAVRC